MFLLKIRKSPLVSQPLLHLIKDIIQDRLQGRRLCSFWAPRWGSSRRELLQLYFMALECLQCTGNPRGESRSTQLGGARNAPHFGKLHWRSRTPSLDFHDKKSLVTLVTKKCWQNNCAIPELLVDLEVVLIGLAEQDPKYELQIRNQSLYIVKSKFSESCLHTQSWGKTYVSERDLVFFARSSDLVSFGLSSV